MYVTNNNVLPRKGTYLTYLTYLYVGKFLINVVMSPAGTVKISVQNVLRQLSRESFVAIPVKRRINHIQLFLPVCQMD